jgi:hypothetical protein
MKEKNTKLRDNSTQSELQKISRYCNLQKNNSVSIENRDHVDGTIFIQNNLGNIFLKLSRKGSFNWVI